MKKNWIKFSIYIIVAVMFFSGCALRSGSVKSVEPDAKTYALITKAQGNPYNDMAAEGFKEIIEEEGGNCIISSPEEATVEEQITMIRSMIDREVDGIAIAANDRDALQSVLTEAMDAGIKVSTMDSNTNAASRMTFVNQVSTKQIGQVLMDAVYDITGGTGQWAILSTTSQATNQNSWVYAMKQVMEESRYSNLSLVNIVYGQDDHDMSVEKTQNLLKEYPDLKVICAPTTVGIEAVAEVLTSMGDTTNVKVTGLGLPSNMAPYIIGGEKAVCPYMYLWNPLDLGRLSAYVSIALVNGEISGAAGDTFQAGSMGTYEIISSEDGGTEVIVAPPLKFDSTNIMEWKELF